MSISRGALGAFMGPGRGPRVLLGAGLLLAACGQSLQAQVSVTTWGNDIERTGQNLNETVLNTSNVNPTQFGKLFSQVVDGYLYAQPLYLQNVTIGGLAHNVVFVATEHDSVYAFDADSNSGANANPLWFASMLTAAHGAAAGATTVSSNDVGTDIVPEVGITGTPVIDPSSGTLYVVSATEEGSTFVQRLHALNITSGAEKFGGPVVITATVAGTGNGSSGGNLTFDSEWENQRPGLLLLNGIVYIGFAAHSDAGPWHGWILGYNAQTLKQTGVFCASANGVGGGFWMGGAGLAAEVVDPVNHPYGRMFIATGNGDYTATTPYKAGMDFGDSVLNLDLANGVPTIQDEFTPSIQASLDADDGDQGAGGVLILPNQATGSYPHLLVQAGKSGEVYLLNRENLGGYHTTGDQVVQGLPYTVGKTGTWTSPVYWNGTVYYWGQTDTLKAFPLVNGQLTGPTAVSSETYGFPGATPSISANGNTQGILWSIDSEGYMTGGSAVLQAHDASNPNTTLYSSTTNSSQDNPGPATKFTVPSVANGKVYVGTQSQLSVFGLLNGQRSAATPVLSPGAETFSGSLVITISDATTGATIYYTLDGSTPTVASAVYSTSITITATTTIRAMATASGYLQSAVATAAYTINLPAKITPAVKVTPSSSNISTNQALQVTVAVSGGTGNPTPTGSVILTSGNYSSVATPLSGGSATIDVPAGSLSTGDDSLKASYTPDASSSSIYIGTSNTATVTVTMAKFSLAATAVTVAPGTPGTSTVTVSSNTGYAGTITLTCAVTSSPVGATNLPTCLGGQAVTLTSGTQSGSSTATVNTLAAISSALPKLRPGKRWSDAGTGAALALLVFLGVPAPRRRWQSMLSILAVMVVLGSLAGCAGVSVTNNATSPGTTAGGYTITVTGTGNDAAKITEKTTFTLTVN